MKKLFTICILLLLAVSLSHAQYSKTETVAKANNVDLKVLITYDANMNEVDYMFTIIGQDQRYHHIVSLMSPFFGSAEDVMSFLTEVMAFNNRFASEEITADIKGVRVRRVRILGYQTWIDEPDGLGYMSLPDKACDKFISALKKYCDSKNIPTTTK